MRWRFYPPILRYLAGCAGEQLAGQIAYLQAENRVLRARLPKRLVLTAQEKGRLLPLAAAIREHLHALVSVCRPETILRWLRAAEAAAANVAATPVRKPGRPRTADDLRALVVRIARETGFGYTRIVGELRRLGIGVSRQTVKNILAEAGLAPGPSRGPGSWALFLRAHAETLWQADFFSVKAWTPRGLREHFALAFLHVGSRKVWVSPATARPDAAWVVRQAEAFTRDTAAPEHAVVFHDRDGKFPAAFKTALAEAGFRAVKLPPRQPNMRPHIERWVQSIKHEALESFVVLGERHLNHLIAEYAEYFNEHRPHSAHDFRTPSARDDPYPDQPPRIDQIRHRQKLGGVLNWYERQAA